MSEEQDPFARLLSTKYDAGREQEAIDLLEAHSELARLEWQGPDDGGKAHVRGATALHYAANDGKLRLMKRLVAHGADVNADNACWFRSVLSWAANNARIEALRWLLDHGARADSLDALHAAAWGGSSAGRDESHDSVGALRLLIEAGADPADRRHVKDQSPLEVALESGNQRAIEFLRSLT